MLSTLRIKNLALVPDATLEFGSGFNVVTGETGAGKSIIFGALSLLLGDRADRKLIRAGESTCAVEAIFMIDKQRSRLDDFLAGRGLEPCEDSQLVVKRTFTSGGSNRQFVNGSPTQLSTLSAIGDILVDFHGPFEHQSLLQSGRQLAILDAFAELAGLDRRFSALYRQRAELAGRRAEFVGDEQATVRELDLLRHQVDEIRVANLDPDEEDLLNEAFQRTSHAARILELSQSAVQLLQEDELALLNQAGRLGQWLEELKRMDSSVVDWQDLHERGTLAFRELLAEWTRYADQVELDPARLRDLEDRLNLIQSLKRKYGSTLAAVIRFGKEAALRMNRLDHRAEEKQALECEWDQVNRELWEVGTALSRHREAVIPKLVRTVNRELRDLGFARGRFDVALTRCASLQAFAARPNPRGLDTVDYCFAPNTGEPARPLRAIASSGEMARVMLALRTVLALQDEVPVLVFDEVDANVGGETARAVGEKMSQIGRRHQVFCITHLAPVAACSQAHYLVFKKIVGGRTLSGIRKLSADQRVEEIARMLGGKTDAARRHASSLLMERE